METPEIHALNKIHWQFFGTLTFKRERMSDRVRHSLLFAHLRAIAKQFGLPFDHLLWVVRKEDGETFGRTHFHYLIAGLDRRYENRSTCFWLMSCWEHTQGAGHARVHRFDPRLNAGGYLLKGGAFNDRTLGGDHYESAKFLSPDRELMIANTVWKVARRRSKKR